MYIYVYIYIYKMHILILPIISSVLFFVSSSFADRAKHRLRAFPKHQSLRLSGRPSPRERRGRLEGTGAVGLVLEPIWDH